MNMLTRIRQGPLGPMGEEEKAVIAREEHMQKVREARVRIARSVRGWTELEEAALVKRGPWWVHADTDKLFSPVLGAVFASGRADVISDKSPYYFAGLPDGGLAFFERVEHPPSYTAYLEHRARKGRAA